MTPLDVAHADMIASPEDDAARLRFYERLASCELFMMLQEEHVDETDTVVPDIFELDADRYVLVFDLEERLAGFSGGSAPYVALSGRAIVSMLSGQNIGMGVNLDTADSQILLPASIIDWLSELVGNAPDAIEDRIEEFSVPTGLPENLIKALDAKLATAMGLATKAYLVAVSYQGAGRGHLLGFVGAVPEAEAALARAVTEALTFSGIEAGTLDVGFFRTSDPLIDKLDRVGMRFDLPQLQESVTQSPQAPGSDPAKPPRLK